MILIKIMSKKTIHAFIFSVLIFLGSLSACLYLFYEIDRQGVRLEEQVTILAQNNSKEEIYRNIKRTVQETETERGEIANKFFKDENDAISFLNEVESIAPSFGLDFKTKDLGTVSSKDDKLQSIKMTFVYKGNEDKVMNFTKLMENIPYHSYVGSLSLKELSEDEWEGELTILISIKPS